jgi:hypothetical protein
MEAKKLKAKTDSSGALKIQLSQENANKEFDVIIVFQPSEPSSHFPNSPEELGFSRNFLENVIGSWEGESLERPDQLPWTEREEVQWPTS